MSRSDSAAILSVLWLIASNTESVQGFAIFCAAMFAIYSLRAVWFVIADRKVKP